MLQGLNIFFYLYIHKPLLKLIQFLDDPGILFFYQLLDQMYQLYDQYIFILNLKNNFLPLLLNVQLLILINGRHNIIHDDRVN